MNCRFISDSSFAACAIRLSGQCFMNLLLVCQKIKPRRKNIGEIQVAGKIHGLGRKEEACIMFWNS